MAIEIGFEGWFQCRLATDGDDYDEPRGQVGWTFAFGNEADLDRVIRFQNPVGLRTHAPDVNVKVTRVAVNGTELADSPLLGTPVELLDDAVFEGRNGEIAVSAQEPIAPFHIQIAQGQDFRIRRSDPINLNDFADVLRRQPVDGSMGDSELIAATGISDPVQFRTQRLQTLKQDRASATDPNEKAILDGRILELQNSLGFPSGVQFRTMLFRLDYDHALTGPADVHDPNQVLAETVDANTPWRVKYFMGGWDADTLCGFTRGTLIIPTTN